MTPQQANEQLRAALKRISETRFGYDGDCGVTIIADEALEATADCAPAPAEPAVDRDAVTVDHQKIKDAAYFLVLNKKDSFAKGWPLFVQIADEVLATPASPAVPASPTTILPTNESEK